MSDLAEFLLARIADDEALARAAAPAPWVSEEHTDSQDPSRWSVSGPVPDGQPWLAEVVGVAYDRDYQYPEGGCRRREDAEHIARHDPARVLAECEAKRRIVGWHVAVAERVEGVPALEPRQNELGMVLRALALPYADHPDYREEWPQ